MKNITLAFVSLVLCSLAMPAVAQERSNASYNREVSLTYSFLHDDGHNAATGMNVDFGKQLTGKMSLVGEVALNHFSSWDETYTQVAGGVRFGSVVNARLRPFAQIMVGVQHDFGSNGFNVQPGAGVNVRLGKGFDAKVQMDLPIVRWEGTTYKQFRLNAGIGVPLGGR